LHAISIPFNASHVLLRRHQSKKALGRHGGAAQ